MKKTVLPVPHDTVTHVVYAADESEIMTDCTVGQRKKYGELLSIDQRESLVVNSYLPPLLESCFFKIVHCNGK